MNSGGFHMPFSVVGNVFGLFTSCVAVMFGDKIDFGFMATTGYRFTVLQSCCFSDCVNV